MRMEMAKYLAWQPINEEIMCWTSLLIEECHRYQEGCVAVQLCGEAVLQVADHQWMVGGYFRRQRFGNNCGMTPEFTVLSHTPAALGTFIFLGSQDLQTPRIWNGVPHRLHHQQVPAEDGHPAQPSLAKQNRSTRQHLGPQKTIQTKLASIPHSSRSSGVRTHHMLDIVSSDTADN